MCCSTHVNCQLRYVPGRAYLLRNHARIDRRVGVEVRIACFVACLLLEKRGGERWGRVHCVPSFLCCIKRQEEKERGGEVAFASLPSFLPY